MMMATKQKDRNQHIKVFTRVRPRNTQECRSTIIVECVNNKEIVVKDKGFAFDRVFGPESKQVDVYKAVVGPLITEVLQGYNCTVFAYGQTGTGKTFTMVGDRTNDLTTGWETDPLCGIIPRTLDHLFDELKVRSEESTVRVSFLELYNEELFDLLAPINNDDTKVLRLFEDSMKKGSVIVSGLVERTVYGKNDVYPILEQGSLRRQTAPTLMNAQSSRSHTIFTITVHVKVTTPEGEDLFKTGKLNLVDLAGSENIGRSGAVDLRAREAGNINQSLLTLGRVITSLVERAPHVPYRESKLTRLLQDSLGGRTKTSIIATISPALCNLEETLSTLEYAHRARNITIKPEINQKTSKHVLLKNYTDEIERLRRDLMATREKHGVYLQLEDYNAMTTQNENLRSELSSKIQLVKVREEEMNKLEEVMGALKMGLTEAEREVSAKEELIKLRERAVSELHAALQELCSQAQEMQRVIEDAAGDTRRLHDRLERSRRVNKHNADASDNFSRNVTALLSTLTAHLRTFRSDAQVQLDEMKEHNEAHAAKAKNHLMTIEAIRNGFCQVVNAQIHSDTQQLINTLQQCGTQLASEASELSSFAESFGAEMLRSIVDHVQNAHQKSSDAYADLNRKVDVLINSDITIMADGLDTLHRKVDDGRERIVKQHDSMKQNVHELDELRSQCFKYYSAKETAQMNELESRLKILNDQRTRDEVSLTSAQAVHDQVKQQTETLERQLEESRRLERKCADIVVAQQQALEVTMRMQKEVEEALEAQKEVANATREKFEIEWKNTHDQCVSTIREGFQEISNCVDECVQLLKNPVSNAHKTTKMHLEEVLAATITQSEFTLNNWIIADSLVAEFGNSVNTKCSSCASILLNVASEASSRYSLGEASLATTRLALAEFEAQDSATLRDGIECEDAAIVDMANTYLALGERINAHADCMVNSFHECSNEFKVHFKEKLLRDEQTGNTPQRREFTYPKPQLVLPATFNSILADESVMNGDTHMNHTPPSNSE